MRILILVAIVVTWPATGSAHPHSARECREGGDFIGNAALARDAGYTRDFFIGRLEEDFVMIRAFPPDLRWFVRDPSDEEFLRGEVDAVFNAPTSGDQHRAGFLQRCTLRAEREKNPDA